MPDIDPPGYELLDRIEIDTRERMRAVADPIRALIADLVLERAMTVTDLAQRVGRAKGTVAHHVDVLCATGLLRVVRTRKVRAMDERFYGRTARTYVFPAHDRSDDLPLAAEANREWDRARRDTDDIGGFTLRHARVPAARAKEFWNGVERLAIEFTRSSRGGDVEYAFYAAVFPTSRPVVPRTRATPVAATRKRAHGAA